MSYRYLPLLLLLACCHVQAQVYKCVAANGDLTFSQTPCPDKDSKVTIERSVTTRNNDDDANCKFAHGFALTTARGMKRGVASNAVFDQYGGLGALSRGSVSLISYVYQYRTNDDVSAERVAALSLAKCQANAFGDVSCEELPKGYTNQIGGCGIPEGISDAMMDEMIQREGAAESPQRSGNTAASQSRTRVSPEARAHANAERRQARDRAEQRQAECKQRIRDRIEVINDELRRGYSASRGITLREQRRDLEQQLKEC